VPVLASDDAKKRVANEHAKISHQRRAQRRARARRIFVEALEPAPALGFKAFGIRGLAV
jgi:hypothetical protein